jgi:hypothetical protein
VPEDGSWTNSDSWGEPREELVPIAGRIELLGLSLGIGDTTELIDPEEENPHRPPGVGIVPLVAMDLSGHLHVGGQCLPAVTPYLLTSDALDELIDGLTQIRGAMDDRYPDRERRSPQ